MKITELAEKLNLTVLSGEKGLSKEIKGCYVSDLLSDVLGNATSGNAWITLHTHKNTMAVASLKELSCIILVNGLKPAKDTIEKSNEENIPILYTNKQNFEITGMMYSLLNNQ